MNQLLTNRWRFSIVVALLCLDVSIPTPGQEANVSSLVIEFNEAIDIKGSYERETPLLIGATTASTRLILQFQVSFSVRRNSKSH